MPDLYHFLVTHWGLSVATSALIAVFVACAVVVGTVLFVVGFSTYVERKVAADIQRRIGPNQCNLGPFFGELLRVVVENGKLPQAGALGRAMAAACKPFQRPLSVLDRILGRLAPGVLIFMADGLKLILKEDIIPDAVDKPLFRAAPYIVLASALGGLAVLPFSDKLYIADFNIGIFYIAAITSLEVLGILMAGWASNNKWALLGGMRSAAQIVSYELPVGLAIATVVLVSGTLSMQGICYSQLALHPGSDWHSSGWFWQWNIFHPAMFVLAPAYFLASLAECNRTPFDIPEAESELVAGYHTEYSGMRFSLFFMAEYAMMVVTSAVAVTLFLGGWSTGLGPLEWAMMAEPPGFDAAGVMTQPVYAWYGWLVHLLAFGLKTYALILLMMWIRWTLPRFRVDQVMGLCWKKLIPISLACLLCTASWMVVRMMLAEQLGATLLEHITFWLRAAFALGVTAWLVWYFRRPIAPEEVAAQEEVLAQAGPGPLP
ncbi:MAG: complex I subunit 1 family protein [Planctomycetota bacterium]